MVAAVPEKVCAAAVPVPTAVMALPVARVGAVPAEKVSLAFEGREPALKVSAALLPPLNLVTSIAAGVLATKVSLCLEGSVPALQVSAALLGRVPAENVPSV